jgi:hypothetical protein
MDCKIPVFSLWNRIKRNYPALILCSIPYQTDEQCHQRKITFPMNQRVLLVESCFFSLKSILFYPFKMFWEPFYFLSYFQAQGQISLISRSTLTFGLTHYPYSEFELLAEELLMSDSTVQVFISCWFSAGYHIFGHFNHLLGAFALHCC